MTTKQIPIWIDCDTGTDDTVAIMLAHALPELQIIGLSAVAGNSLLCNTFPNTRRVVHLLGADYPVYPGAERPLVREPHVAGAFHGENGLGNVQLPLPDTAPEQTPAWDALYAAAKRMPGELRLVATGPLTNVAIALTKYPDLHGLLHSIALMGGAAVGGNVTPAAEFNIYDDPDAAQIVFKSGVPLVMCGLDVTMQAELRPADWDEMAGYGNRCGGLVKELFACAWKTIQTVGLTGVAQHDSCPVMYLAHPELFEGRMAGVFVETQGAVTLGKTVTDLQSDKKFGVQNALEQAKGRAREAYQQHPDKGFRAVGSTYTFSTRGADAVVEAEFGPEKPRGALANITIWGTSKGGGGMPHPSEFMDQHVLDEIGDTLDEIVRSLT